VPIEAVEERYSSEFGFLQATQHVLTQVAGQFLRASTPKSDFAFAIDDVNAGGQRFEDDSIEIIDGIAHESPKFWRRGRHAEGHGGIAKLCDLLEVERGQEKIG
jgi:hypothetical protein